jgi:hypothetical protein
MKTKLEKYTVRQLVDGFVYSELEGKGLFGLSGTLTIQPEYQRAFVYSEKKKEAPVIHSLLNEYPLGVLYFNTLPDGKFEVLDGQQRITSIGRFVTNKFSIIDANGREQIFSGLAADQQDRILDSVILVYECEGTETEIRQWFQTINIAGVPLNEQELLNAVYSGPFVTAGKSEFSNSQNANIRKWSAYIKGSALSQDYWERALEWVSGGKSNIGGYMSSHRFDKDINEVRTYFNSVIDWAESVFLDIENEMAGLDWGRFFETYKGTAYNATEVAKEVRALYSDPCVENRRGIWEYILGGSQDTALLDVRFFEDSTKRATYAKQTEAAKAAGVSNCSDCAKGHEAGKAKIWKADEMDADHVRAWSKKGRTTADNCEMLCKRHNRAKGNK